MAVEGLMRVIRREVRRRGFFGWLFLILFLAFNALMLLWLVAAIVQVAQMDPGPTDAHKVGGAVGAAIGYGLILFMWVCGAVITGLLAMLTRGRRTVIEETVE